MCHSRQWTGREFEVAPRSTKEESDLHTGEVHNYWAWDHMHNVPMGRPLLALDMYEHSYHLDYGAAAAKYVEAFMENVDWDEVRRVEGALGARLA